MAAQKTSGKTSAHPGIANLRRGNPGNKGGGRPSQDFLAYTTRITEANLPTLEAYLESHDPSDPMWLKCWEAVSRFCKSPAPTKSEMKVEVQTPKAVSFHSDN